MLSYNVNIACYGKQKPVPFLLKHFTYDSLMATALTVVELKYQLTKKYGVQSVTTSLQRKQLELFVECSVTQCMYGKSKILLLTLKRQSIVDYRKLG